MPDHDNESRRIDIENPDTAPISGGEEFEVAKYIDRMLGIVRNKIRQSRKSGRLRETRDIVHSAVGSFEKQRQQEADKNQTKEEVWIALQKHLERKIDTERHSLRAARNARRREPGTGEDDWLARAADKRAIPGDEAMWLGELLEILEKIDDADALRVAQLQAQGYTQKEVVELTGMSLHQVRMARADLRAHLRRLGYWEGE